MAGSADSLRGDWLVSAQKALAGLEGNPQLLDRARGQLDDSPLPYTSDRSGAPARSQNPNPPSEEQRRLDLALERDASQPYNQFQDQRRDEERRAWDADQNRTHRVPVGSCSYTIAYEKVKKWWVEQGIWNDKWTGLAVWRWKHEEPLELEPESDADSEETSPPFSFFPREPQPKRPKSDEEKQQIAEWRAIREREREASRPYHQFVFQVSKERERIQDVNAHVRKTLGWASLTSARRLTRMSRTLGPSEGFGTKDGA